LNFTLEVWSADVNDAEREKWTRGHRATLFPKNPLTKHIVIERFPHITIS